MASSSKVTWTTEQYAKFIEFCVEERNNMGVPGSFKKSPHWNNILVKLNQLPGTQFEYKHVKNKWDAVRKEWSAWNAVSKQTGIGWDNTRNTFAGDEEWWDRMIKEHGIFVKKFKTGPIQFKEQLDFLFGTTVATGEFAFTATGGFVNQTEQDEEVVAETQDWGNDMNEHMRYYQNILGCSDSPTPPTPPESQNVRRNVAGKKKATKRTSGAMELSDNISRLVHCLEIRTKKHVLNQATKYNQIRIIRPMLMRQWKDCINYLCLQD